MKKHFTALAIFLVFAAVLSFVENHAYAFGGGDDGPAFGKRPLQQMAAKLGLSEQQKQQIKELFSKEQPQMQPLRKQHVAERRALRTLIQADVIDEQAIRTQAGKIAQLEADMAVQRAHLSQKIRVILTPDQIDKFKALQKERDQKHDKFFSRAAKRFQDD